MKKILLFGFLYLACFISAANAQFINGPSAISVIGQVSFDSSSSGTTASKFNGPMGVAVDTNTGKVFVSDRYNNRVLRFTSAEAYKNGGSAEAVFGQTNFTTSTTPGTPTAASINNPIGVCFDRDGRLWVSDFGNNRILRFDNASTKSTGANADAVLGQTTFGTKTSGITQSTLNQPVGLYYDDNTHNLWVADFGNHRVLKFINAETKTNGAAADVVLGQALFTTKTTGITASTMNNPNGVYVDVLGNLWVSDRVNDRFLKFNNADSKTNGANADGVLGQPDFVTKVSSITQNGSGYARFVWGDKNGRIYCMQENHRILVFENGASKPNGANADGVIGQVDYTSQAYLTSPSNFKDPKGMYVNNSTGEVWVAEQTNQRVMRFKFKSINGVAVVAPNGGEEWGHGSSQTISWVGNYYGKVNLSYSTNSGTSWTLIDTAATISGNSSYNWKLPEISSANCLVKITDFTTDTLTDASDSSFLIADKSIVIVGSSTAAGQGPVNVDSAWVWRYRRYVKSIHPSAIVVNLAVGGYSTYECMPTGFVPPSGKAAPHTNANITKALSLNPDAIIVNLPTNDAYWNYTLNETLSNYDTIVTTAKRQNKKIWISTSQGRNLSQAGRDLLIATRDSILSIYGQYALDFWTGTATADGYILANLNSGDGVHMNSDGHKILFDKVVAAGIFETTLPVELTSFTASAKDNSVQLSWNTATEINNRGFEVERTNSGKSAWQKLGFVSGNGTTTSQSTYSFTDKSVSFGNYSYRLKQIDQNGKFEYSKTIEVEAGSIPNGFYVSQNFPNPFNPSTTIKFAFSVNTNASLKVYDQLGRQVAVLFNGQTEAGKIYNIDFNASNLASGVYFYRLESPLKSDTHKMILMK